VKLLDFGLAKIKKPVAVAQETFTMAQTSPGADPGERCCTCRRSCQQSQPVNLLRHVRFTSGQAGGRDFAWSSCRSRPG
jgi:hypothetical protein